MPYIGTTPTKVVSRQSANVYRYTATAGQTAFTGADLDNQVLACNPADLAVHMNGLRLESTDYTATSTTVTLTTAATAGDEVTVTAFSTFEVADTYSKATADGRYVNSAGDTMTGTLYIGNGSGTSQEIKKTNMGYAGNYSVLQLGQDTGTDLSIVSLFVDPSLNPSGSFSGYGKELLVPQDFRFISPNPSNTDYRRPIRFADGQVLREAQSFVHGYPSGGSHTSPTKHTLNATYSNSAAFGSSRYTCPVDGLYECVFNTAVNNNGYENDVWVYRNGATLSPVMGSWATANSTWTNLHLQVMIPCSANDYLEFYTRGYTYGNTSWNYFHFRLVG